MPQNLFAKICPLLLFNDDAIVRHLDRLYEVDDIHETAFLLQTCERENIPLKVLFHGGTTSMSLYGACTESSEVFDSRDRIGAKQIQFRLIGNGDYLLIYEAIHDGNQSDREWNPDVLAQLHESFQRTKLE
ncbi:MULTISPECIES: hypothetical protein [Anoxybacillaceae]|nr:MULTISPECIES: hypothetical protein [Anoxybacillus]MBS2770944.1 hypothetical protein [Anoxybacillus rupiensis]QHC04333.1 hypothetical protein GRQ40_10430 [Anoxybacillus sp. PDR2]